MNNPKYLNLYDPKKNNAIEFDMDTVDRIVVAPARELMDTKQREAGGIDAMDMVVRVQFKGESSKEFSLRQYEMELIYP